MQRHEMPKSDEHAVGEARRLFPLGLGYAVAQLLALAARMAAGVERQGVRGKFSAFLRRPQLVPARKNELGIPAATSVLATAAYAIGCECFQSSGKAVHLEPNRGALWSELTSLIRAWRRRSPKVR
jgi:hypothetical protein